MYAILTLIGQSMDPFIMFNGFFKNIYPFLSSTVLAKNVTLFFVGPHIKLFNTICDDNQVYNSLLAIKSSNSTGHSDAES